MRFICLLIIFFISSLQSLELNRVILASNNNPLYIEFWPVVAPLWKAMGLQPTLALVANETCPVDTSLGDVIYFPPLEGVPESLQAQTIRLFLPALFPDDGCLIADIDMLPISRSYFLDGAKACPNNAFLVYRDQAFGYWGDRFPMCYVAAKGAVFGSVFAITSKEKIINTIRDWNRLNLGWNTDELMLFTSLMSWEQKGGQIVRLGHGVSHRLDRMYWNNFNSIDVSGYIDCHCPRPYSAYKHSIDIVAQAIYDQLRKQ